MQHRATSTALAKATPSSQAHELGPGTSASSTDRRRDQGLWLCGDDKVPEVEEEGLDLS